MRWNCPHCRTQLDAPDGEISASWCFALCAHCSRFGLIRGSSRLAVKVDRAPPGESFIRAAIAGPAPVIRPAQPRAQAQPTQAAAQTRTPAAAAETPKKLLEARLPEPLPEVPEKRRFFLSRFVFLGCAALLAWSGYRYQRITTGTIADTTTDTIAADAMAPQQIEAGSTIQPRTLNALIHNNPGHQFPVIGALDPSQRYSVLEVQSRTDGQWYRVDADTPSPAWVSIQDVSPAH